MGFVTRFAPSPTGELHLGHAFAALTAEAWARLSGGRFLLRIDDLDHTRCRHEFERAIYDDLDWMGLRYDADVRRQSNCMAEYAAALDRLRGLGVLYPCFCTRAEIQAELAAMAGAPQGPEGPLYPGTCRDLSDGFRDARLRSGMAHAWRIDVAKAGMGGGCALGDVVLSRKETPASYHLAVVVDDAATGVTLVTRGDDLESATGLHMALQRLLGLPAPAYAHHRLIVDETGKRLAKRDKARSLRQLRAGGATPDDIRRMVDWPAMEAEITNRLARSSF